MYVCMYDHIKILKTFYSINHHQSINYGSSKTKKLF